MAMPTEKIARILRTDRHSLEKLAARLSAFTRRTDVMEKIVEENEAKMRDRLLRLGIAREPSAKTVYDALIAKIEDDNATVAKALQNPSSASHPDCERVLSLALKAVNPPKGFFLKKEKAIEFLMQEPPQKILRYLGYDSVEAMLAKESLLEVYCALRFVEGSEWLNSTFFKHYENLTPDDFEERAVEALALSPRWNKAAEAFVLKKWHNISHLKEMGVVFVIPLSLGIPGELLRMLALVFHYLHEVPFYADVARNIAGSPTTFAQNYISLLRGDTLERRLPEGEKSLWLVVQRYLAKDDENDWRLFAPRINPEALHWLKAEEDFSKLSDMVDGFKEKVAFWDDLDWVGDFFKDEVGQDVLVSFNLVDSVMSLVMEKELIKYLYHHQEALWNKIFMEYFSRAEVEHFAKEYLLQGYFEI